MATWFEIWLVGDDADHLAAVAEAALDEATRLEQLLSRFDATSEVSRVNREASSRAVRVDPELFSILEDCEAWRVATDGYFDVARTLGRSAAATEPGHVDRPPAARFCDADAKLDFGGYAKGYALARMAGVLDRFGVGDALMHGGTSSVLARGRGLVGHPWKIGWRDPFGASPEALLQSPRIDDLCATFREELKYAGGDATGEIAISSSASLGPGQLFSDVCDPRRRAPISEHAAVVVISTSASAAEALSTALLAMGRDRANKYCRERPAELWRAGWIDQWAGATRFRRLGAKTTLDAA
jgi:thiamine biosynthesis lipoprotein